MTAAKNSNHIQISGTGNTLASVTSDIADTTFIEKTGTSPDVYTVKGNVGRQFRIMNGGELTIGDPLDFTNDETLAFDPLANSRTTFYCYGNGQLYQYGATTIDFSSNATYYPQYAYLYGGIHVEGDGTNNPVWKNFRRMYLRNYDANNTYDKETYFYEMTIGSNYSANQYGFFVDFFRRVYSIHFENVTFDISVGTKNVNTHFFYFTGVFPSQKMVLKGLDFVDAGIPIQNVRGTPLLFEDCTFSETSGWNASFICNAHPDTCATYYSDGENDTDTYGQVYSMMDNCDFENYANKNGIHIQYGACVVFRDCDWQATSNDSIQITGPASAWLWTGNVFSGGNETYDLNNGGYVNRVHGLDLTIEDPDGNGIDGAFVHIEQSEGKEKYLFKTDASGKLIAVHGHEVALLCHQHQYGDNESTAVEYWSDSSNGTSHDVVITANGYHGKVANYVMDQERSDTIVLHSVLAVKALSGGERIAG